MFCLSSKELTKQELTLIRSRTFDTLVEALQSGNLPREEIENWANGQSVEVVDALLEPENESVEEAFRKVGKTLTNKTDHKTKNENPSDEDYQEDLEQNLPASSAGDTLKSAFSHYGYFVQ